MQTTVDSTGTYAVIAGFVVTLLAHFGIVIDTASVTTVIGAMVIIWGVVKQLRAHKTVNTILAGMVANTTNGVGTKTVPQA